MPVAPDLRGSALDGRYELHELIGEGAFGRVYRGRDRRLARAVAIKVIKPWWAEDPEWVAAFEREAQLLARVSHPGIVQIYDIGHGADGLYYVAELVAGESLAQRLQRGPLAPREAAAAAERLCLALEHAHRRGIVHRDVKPANILLARDGTVKLGDFGVARLAEGSTGGLTAAGTPRYMSPEQARGERLERSSDLYSAGVVLYEMLAGEPPFAGSSVAELALRHVCDPPPALDRGVPAGLRRVVTRALAKAPAERYASAGQMARALARARGGEGTAALGESASPARTARRAQAPTGLERTRVRPRSGEVRRFAPAARRRAGALVAMVAAVAAVMAIVAAVLAIPHKARVPALRGLAGPAALARLRHHGLRASARSAHSLTVARGEVISQRPAAGRVLDDGARVALLISSGPPPVQVPPLDGVSAYDAQSSLRHERLHARLVTVPAPGQAPGTVVHQQPAAGHSVPSGSTIVLSVAQTPRWRYLTSFSGTGPAASPRFQILGGRFRVVYTLHYAQGCTFLLFSFCSGPTVSVLNVASGRPVARFGLNSGSGIARQIASGPGEYELQLTPGETAARWSIAIDDYY